jgi:hypothetical protein
MQTWKKIVIASSATIIIGIGVYYIIQSQRIKKIKDRGFTINVSTVQDQRTNIPTFPEDESGNEREIIANAAGEFVNIFKKLFNLQ